MSIFGEEEKKIMDKIVLGEGYSRNLINILDSLNNLQGVRVSVDPSTNTAEYLFQTSSTNPSTEEYQDGIIKEKEFTQKLITHLLILESLDKEGLAFFFTPTDIPSKKIQFGAGAVNMPSFSMPIYDKKIIELLIKYLHVEIIPKPSLVHLQKNKYRNDDERRFGLQMIATWSALTVSIAIGLFGIYSNYESGKSSDKKFNEIIGTIDASVGKIGSTLKFLMRAPVDYSVSLQEIDMSINFLSQELAVISKKEITVKIPEAMLQSKYNKQRNTDSGAIAPTPVR